MCIEKRIFILNCYIFSKSIIKYRELQYINRYVKKDTNLDIYAININEFFR